MSGRFSLKQGTDFGSASSLSSINLSALPLGTALGDCWEQDGNAYQWVKVSLAAGPVAVVANGAAIWKDQANYVVTSGASGAQTANSLAGGFLTAGVTDNYYTVIQYGGIQTGVKVAAGTAAGDQLSQSATDQTLAKTTAGTASVNQIGAIALTAVSSGTSTVSWVL